MKGCLIGIRGSRTKIVSALRWLQRQNEASIRTVRKGDARCLMVNNSYPFTLRYSAYKITIEERSNIRQFKVGHATQILSDFATRSKYSALTIFFSSKY